MRGTDKESLTTSWVPGMCSRCEDADSSAVDVQTGAASIRDQEGHESENTGEKLVHLDADVSGEEGDSEDDGVDGSDENDDDHMMEDDGDEDERDEDDNDDGDLDDSEEEPGVQGGQAVRVTAVQNLLRLIYGHRSGIAEELSDTSDGSNANFVMEPPDLREQVVVPPGRPSSISTRFDMQALHEFSFPLYRTNH